MHVHTQVGQGTGSQKGLVMLEKEIKILLSKEQYDQVEGLFSWDKDYLQSNYYFIDLEKFKKSRGFGAMCNTVRIREKGNEFRLQVKAFVSKQGNLHIMREFEKKVDKVNEVVYSAELEDLTGMKFNDLDSIGKLVTHRKECNEYKGITICLDKNNYLGLEDYELELEYNGDYPDFLVDKLEESGIYTGGEEVDGKYIRFTKSWDKGRGSLA